MVAPSIDQKLLCPESAPRYVILLASTVNAERRIPPCDCSYTKENLIYAVKMSVAVSISVTISVTVTIAVQRGL